MVQFLSIIFFSWISSIFVGVFQKFPLFLCHPVLITDNGNKSSIFATILPCTDTVVISGLSTRYKNDAFNYQGCQPLGEKLSFFAEVTVKGGNLQITLLTPDTGAITQVTLLTSGSCRSL